MSEDGTRTAPPSGLTPPRCGAFFMSLGGVFECELPRDHAEPCGDAPTPPVAGAPEGTDEN